MSICASKTVKGKQCTRKALPGSPYCFQHKKLHDSDVASSSVISKGKKVQSIGKKVKRKKEKKQKKEFYILELRVDPGGARKHVLYVWPSLEQVFRTLQQDLIADAGLAIWYGEEILLHRCLNYKVIETIDLHPFITFYVGDFPPIRFNEDNEVIGFKNIQFGLSISDDDPIDFTLLDINEVYRYLKKDIYDIFRIMKEQGLEGSNMDRIPPNVGVQIDLSHIPRIEDVLTYKLNREKDIKVKFPDKVIMLQYGENDLGG